MKKIVALILTAMLLCTGMALAAEWEEGTSPSKPYANAREIDLSENLGYMMFYPNDGVAAEHACQRLYIYLPREDVKLAEGTLYLYTEEDGEVWRTEIDNEEAVTLRAISEAELEGLMWGGGVCVEIVLPKTLAVGKTYFLNLTGGSIVAESGVQNEQLGGTDGWRFEVEGDYGVSLMEYRRALGNGRYEEQIAKPQAGDEIRFDLTLGGDAAIAVLYGYNDSVDFLNIMHTESGEVVGTVNAENPAWGVLFLDAEGNALDQVEFW